MIGLVDVVALVIAIVAIRRTRVLLDRIETLERKLAVLRGVPPAPTVREAEAPASVAPPAPPPRAEAPPRLAPPPPPRREPRAPVDWERWFGVRGAAVLGGVALGLAGLLFFKYSIEHGLIPPVVRVVIGTVVGVGCIVGSERTLRRRYGGTADAVAGAGAVTLYAAFWAASALYGLVAVPVSFLLMATVTATCCTLSWRHASQVIAVLGLTGGFATPLLLSSGQDRPIGLFGYALLLDVGVLVLARRRRWPTLALLSLAGTALYEVLWIGLRMGPDRLVLGLGILGVFALLFALAPSATSEQEQRSWVGPQAAGILFPFAFALYFAADARFGSAFHSVALLLVLLCVAAGWVGRAMKTYWIGLGAASATTAVVLAWLLTRPVTPALAWQAAGWTVALALAFHAFVEWEPERPGADGPAPAAMVANLALVPVLLAGSTRALAATPWPWLAGVLGLAAIALRHGGFRARESLQLVAAVAAAAGLVVLDEAGGARPGVPPAALYLAVMVGVSLAFQGTALLRRDPATRRAGAHAASLLPAVLIGHLALVSARFHASPWLFLGATTLLGLLTVTAATRVGSGPWVLVAVLATAGAHAAWSFAPHRPEVDATALAVESMAMLAFTAWPFLAAPRLRTEPFAWRAAALAAPAWFPSLHRLFVVRFGDGAIGVLPLSLALVSFLAALRTHRIRPASDPLRTMVLAWFSAAAMGFVTITIPLQLEKEWITIGWALQGLAVTVLWIRLDHPGLKLFGLALLAGATARLVTNPAVLGYYPRPPFRIVNWLMYTYLVPAAALLITSSLLYPRELQRARAWERTLWYRTGRPLGALVAGGGGLVVIFVWINLAIAEWFATGPYLQVSFERLPARDLATSLGWALYALALLAVGLIRALIGLRWASLGLLVITIAKVFLHDLGELRDLYRVASLLGLAMSLIAVSLAYQRFVFRRAEET